MAENVVQYFPNANWVAIQGNFTPDELREIADEIEKKYSGTKPEKKD